MPRLLVAGLLALLATLVVPGWGIPVAALGAALVLGASLAWTAWGPELRAHDALLRLASHRPQHS